MQTRARLPGVRGTAAAIASACAAAAGCSPTFDWREARLEGTDVAMMFPCRPVKQERTVRVADAARPMRLHSCTAGDGLFMLASIDVADPREVTTSLAAFRAQAAANLAGSATENGPFTPAGATPNPQSARIVIAGARADGQRVVAQAAFFVKGLTLYQAAVLGAGDNTSGREATETFFGAIHLP